MTRTYSRQCCAGLQDERDTAPRCAGASRPRGDGRTPARLWFVPGSGCQSFGSSGRRLCALIFCDGGQGLPGHQPGVLLSIQTSQCEVLPGGSTELHLLPSSVRQPASSCAPPCLSLPTCERLGGCHSQLREALWELRMKCAV